MKMVQRNCTGRKHQKDREIHNIFVGKSKDEQCWVGEGGKCTQHRPEVIAPCPEPRPPKSHSYWTHWTMIAALHAHAEPPL